MTKQLFIERCERVFFPHMNDHCIYPADSWPMFADQDAVEEVNPEELECEMITIPLKITGKSSPSMSSVSNWILLDDQPVHVHHRDLILKLHSLIYRQFTSQRFENLIAQAWHLSGYTDKFSTYIEPV
ncbi:hypothetical protein RvY_05008 [Ramazzottius varieornatus]|uniref:Uncharacterized protein n=1 Tax=Ramazzottius varieornatus TaxID=947166 RepID=A0A1D1V091_RAMVA|nr:hypothetical protein RvY_05008 [Ramazzottius varieornatus]